MRQSLDYLYDQVTGFQTTNFVGYVQTNHSGNVVFNDVVTLLTNPTNDTDAVNYFGLTNYVGGTLLTNVAILSDYNIFTTSNQVTLLRNSGAVTDTNSLDVVGATLAAVNQQYNIQGSLINGEVWYLSADTTYHIFFDSNALSAWSLDLASEPTDGTVAPFYSNPTLTGGWVGEWDASGPPIVDYGLAGSLNEIDFDAATIVGDWNIISL